MPETKPDAELLAALSATEGRTINEIHQISGWDPATIRMHLRVLQAAGQVRAGDEYPRRWYLGGEMSGYEDSGATEPHVRESRHGGQESGRD